MSDQNILTFNTVSGALGASFLATWLVMGSGFGFMVGKTHADDALRDMETSDISYDDALAQHYEQNPIPLGKVGNVLFAPVHVAYQVTTRVMASK